MSWLNVSFDPNDDEIINFLDRLKRDFNVSAYHMAIEQSLKLAAIAAEHAEDGVITIQKKDGTLLKLILENKD